MPTVMSKTFTVNGTEKTVTCKVDIIENFSMKPIVRSNQSSHEQEPGLRHYHMARGYVKTYEDAPFDQVHERAFDDFSEAPKWADTITKFTEERAKILANLRKQESPVDQLKEKGFEYADAISKAIV